MAHRSCETCPPIAGTIAAVGGSMAPFILAGSRLTTQRRDAGKIRIGDVVGFIDAHGSPVAHRVVGIEETPEGRCFSLRGDAHLAVESVPESAVAFAVIRVEHRLFGYDTAGFAGRLISRIALAGGPVEAVMKAACLLGWDSVRAVHRLARRCGR